MKSSVIVSFLCIVCLVACAGRRTKQKQTSDTKPVAQWSYRIVNTYPHDTGSYTQGLFWHDGSLWEGTGEYGSSVIRQVDLTSGDVIRQRELPNEFFGEGAALLNGKIFQLTWRENQTLVWDSATLEPAGRFTYRGEGWGLTTDGTHLYMSDGSANITVRDPGTFAEKRTFQVRHEGDLLQFINELEWIDGRLWANVYLSSEIVVIDPGSGNVEASIDCSSLIAHLVVTPETDFMNGIAFDASTGRIFVTGKRWDKLFEIEIIK